MRQTLISAYTRHFESLSNPKCIHIIREEMIFSQANEDGTPFRRKSFSQANEDGTPIRRKKLAPLVLWGRFFFEFERASRMSIRFPRSDMLGLWNWNSSCWYVEHDQILRVFISVCACVRTCVSVLVCVCLGLWTICARETIAVYRGEDIFYKTLSQSSLNQGSRSDLTVRFFSSVTV